MKKTQQPVAENLNLKKSDMKPNKFRNSHPIVLAYFLAIFFSFLVHGVIYKIFWYMLWSGGLLCFLSHYIVSIQTYSITIDNEKVSFYCSVFFKHHKFLKEEIKAIYHQKNYIIVKLINESEVKFSLSKTPIFYRTDVFFLDWIFMTKEENSQECQKLGEAMEECGIVYFYEPTK